MHLHRNLIKTKPITFTSLLLRNQQFIKREILRTKLAILPHALFIQHNFNSNIYFDQLITSHSSTNTTFSTTTKNNNIHTPNNISFPHHFNNVNSLHKPNKPSKPSKRTQHKLLFNLFTRGNYIQHTYIKDFHRKVYLYKYFEVIFFLLICFFFVFFFYN
eukprot:450739_1